MKQILPIVKRVFRPVHKLLLLVSKALGHVMTYITFTNGFLLFALIGTIYQMVAKDPLDRKIEKERKSYWLKRPQKEFDREKYLRQF